MGLKCVPKYFNGFVKNKKTKTKTKKTLIINVYEFHKGPYLPFIKTTQQTTTTERAHNDNLCGSA